MGGRCSAHTQPRLSQSRATEGWRARAGRASPQPALLPQDMTFEKETGAASMRPGFFWIRELAVDVRQDKQAGRILAYATASQGGRQHSCRRWAWPSVPGCAMLPVQSGDTHSRVMTASSHSVRYTCGGMGPIKCHHHQNDHQGHHPDMAMMAAELLARAGDTWCLTRTAGAL